MTWTPKPGDRVTSPLLVGEWEVESYDHTTHQTRVWHGGSDFRLVTLDADYVSPVVPPLPPEPPIGSVVWARGGHWSHGATGDWYRIGSGGLFTAWSNLAADAVPVVPVNKVADYVESLNSMGDCGYVAAQSIRAEFGGFDA